MLGVANSYSAIMPQDPHSATGLHAELNMALNTDFNFARNDYRVCLASEQSHLHTQASKLVSNMYSSRGLGTVMPALSAVASGHRRPERATLAASRDEDVLGTLTLEVDPGNDLLADSLYRPEIDVLRAQGKRLCEVTRLALHPELSCREVMATLFHVTFLLASVVHGRTDMLAEVHPRHAGFYRRTLGFKVIGPERICLRVGAPAVLMHLCLGFAQNQIGLLAGTCTRGDRNLYGLFLPSAEQRALLEQLTVLS